jgi:hypothetical protein
MLFAFTVVLSVAIELPAVDNPVSEEGLGEIIARLEWYDTSIQSFRIRYQIIRETDPAGMRQMNLVLGRSGPLAERSAERRDEIEEECVTSGEKVWMKAINRNPSPEVEDQAVFVWASDGKEMRTVAYRLDGKPTHGGVVGDSAKVRIPHDSLTLVAGMRFSSRKRALYVDIKEGDLKLKGTVKENGRLLYHLSDAASNETDRTELYLDSTHAFLPVRKDRWLRGKLSNRTSVEEFARFPDATTKEERWFPSKVMRKDFFEGQLVTTHKVTCESLEINPSIPDSLFNLSMPGGILVTDSQTRETRFQGSDEQRREFASKQTAKAKADLDAELARASGSQRTLSSPSRFPWVSLGIGVLGVAMVLLGIAIRRRFSC